MYGGFAIVSQLWPISRAFFLRLGLENVEYHKSFIHYSAKGILRSKVLRALRNITATSGFTDYLHTEYSRTINVVILPECHSHYFCF